jgi:hypothetical protein
MLRGGLYALPTPGHLISASGFSSSRGLLKTPTAQLAVNGGSQPPEKRKAGGHGPTLADQVEHELLPTPTRADGDRASTTYVRGNPTLAGALLPTPTVADSRNSRNATAGRSPESTGHAGTTLSDVFWTGDLTSPQ